MTHGKNIVVTDNKTCRSTYNTDTKTLHTAFKGIVDYNLMIEHIENMMRFSKKNKILAAIVDFSKLRGSFYKIFEKVEKEAYPQFLKSGFNIQAFVVSDDIITANVADRLSEALRKQNGNVEIFSDNESAKEWVQACLKS